ncbi:hypothetical protein C9994_07535 [Marivirga lumbricoides]|uniref:Uncharacterized protein n=1 Tax=Marivirga lumbricoides TaxID=1046115 RepID=A0A2T4DRF0_9BACT|nr:hypothetical protein C9994_07535 [Marivirga lumbricoides]
MIMAVENSLLMHPRCKRGRGGELRLNFRNLWKNHTIKHGDASLIYYAIRDELWQEEHEKHLRKIELETELKVFLENRKSAVVKEAVISGGALVLSIYLFPATGGASTWKYFAASGSILASGSSLVGSYNEYQDLDNKIYNPNRIYAPVKGYLVSEMGSKAAVVYDVVSILVNFKGGYDDALIIYDRFAKIGSVTESQVSTFLRAVVAGNNAVTINNTVINLVP